MNLDSQKFLDDLSGRYARVYFDVIHDMSVFKLLGDRVRYRRALEKLGEVIKETMSVSEVLGASQALRDTAKAIGKDGGELFRRDLANLIRFADDPIQTVLPRVTFEEAIEDMVERAPRTIKQAAERTARKISQFYSEGRAVAFVRSADQAVTERVQGLIETAMRDGIPEADIGKKIITEVEKARTLSQPWSESYAKMAFRTNLNTAVTAGRFRQVQDKDIKAVIPAFMFTDSGGSEVRPNHHAADGMILKVDNPEWTRLASPLGYNCQCSLISMTRPMLRRMGRLDQRGEVIESRIPRDAFPDPGFRQGGRPDLFIQGGGIS